MVVVWFPAVGVRRLATGILLELLKITVVGIRRFAQRGALHKQFAKPVDPVDRISKPFTPVKRSILASEVGVLSSGCADNMIIICVQECIVDRKTAGSNQCSHICRTISSALVYAQLVLY